MLEQKLDYIHHNPVNGKWSLSEDFVSYPYSSAGFYELERENEFVVHYKDLNVVDVGYFERLRVSAEKQDDAEREVGTCL